MNTANALVSRARSIEQRYNTTWRQADIEERVRLMREALETSTNAVEPIAWEPAKIGPDTAGMSTVNPEASRC